MKITNKKIIMFSLLGISVLVFGGCTTNKTELYEGTGTVSQENTTEYVVDASDMLDVNMVLDTSSTGTLSAQEISGLIQMREEEKLARDVYTTLGTVWGNTIFTNIAASEQTHTNAVKGLLTKYGIADPVTDDTIGVFTSATMQKLYTDLVAQGSTSLINALIVGATIEDLDIEDLNNFIQTTNNSDMLQVYNNLNKGSRNHLRAYIKNINNKGGTYIPQYISQAEYTEIIGSQQERGSAGNGNGNKR